MAKIIPQPLKQGDIVWVDYPFAQSPETSKKRPALIISNSECHKEDGQNDFIFIPITRTERMTRYSYVINPSTLMRTLPYSNCEIRTNKIFTLNKTLTFERISEVAPDKLGEILDLVFSAIRKS